MDRKYPGAERAKQLFESGCNCSQAVLGAFCERLSLPVDTAMAIASGFGGGIARLRETCGAVTGMVAAVSLYSGGSDPTDKAAKSALYADIQRLVGEFEQQTGGIICADLLGVPRRKGDPVPEARTREYYKKRPCSELVYLAAQILEEYIEAPSARARNK